MHTRGCANMQVGTNPIRMLVARVTAADPHEWLGRNRVEWIRVQSTGLWVCIHGWEGSSLGRRVAAGHVRTSVKLRIRWPVRSSKHGGLIPQYTTIAELQRVARTFCGIQDARRRGSSLRGLESPRTRAPKPHFIYIFRVPISIHPLHAKYGVARP